MNARILWLLVGAAGLAACSGNLGGGQSTLPGTPQGTSNVSQMAPPTATPTPVSASNVATIGDSVAAQPLPAVMGWSGSIAFAKPSAAPSPSPNAKSTADATASGPISIGVTAAVVEPTDAPHFGTAAAKGRHVSKYTDAAGNTGLLFISLLPTADLTLNEYPKFGIDVPREIATKYRDASFALALFDPQTKEKSYRLAVAERDADSESASTPVPTPTLTAMRTAAPAMSGPPAMGGPPPELTPPPVGAGLDAGLPPQHIAFRATATTLVLKANRPVVFAVYAVAPSPSPSPAAGAAASPGARRSPAAGAASGAAAQSGTSGTSGAAAASGTPAPSAASGAPPDHPTGTPTPSPAAT